MSEKFGGKMRLRQMELQINPLRLRQIELQINPPVIGVSADPMTVEQMLRHAKAVEAVREMATRLEKFLGPEPTVEAPFPLTALGAPQQQAIGLTAEKRGC